jgi:hypothetical protein
MSVSSRNSMVKQQQEEEGVAADVMDVHTTSATGDELMSAAREVVGKAKADLFQRRLSVREMASQFERGQAAAHAAAASTLAHDVCTHVHAYPTHKISFVFCLSFIAIIGFSHQSCSCSCSCGGGGQLLSQQKLKEVAQLDKPALLNKLRSLLSELAGRVAGRNKDDISDALIAVPHSSSS